MFAINRSRTNSSICDAMLASVGFASYVKRMTQATRVSLLASVQCQTAWCAKGSNSEEPERTDKQTERRERWSREKWFGWYDMFLFIQKKITPKTKLVSLSIIIYPKLNKRKRGEVRAKSNGNLTWNANWNWSYANYKKLYWKRGKGNEKNSSFEDPSERWDLGALASGERRVTQSVKSEIKYI